jgi:hypothetical protein
MMEWNLNISYGLKTYKLKAELVYHSEQIMRIKVHGSKSTILLENNYPYQIKKNKRGIQWKIKEGGFTAGTQKSTRLLIDIFKQLEYEIKKAFP